MARTDRPLRIATRKSALALWQANYVKAELEKAHPGLAVELVPIVTTGDKILDVPLAKVGGKGLFTKEIEQALVEGRADLAVHSMKDVPTQRAPGLVLAGTGVREDVRDAFVSRRVGSVDTLPPGAKVGTSSLRRQAQLLHLRPDLQIVSIRGNVETRMRKIEELGLEGVILAAAGLRRLGFAERITQYIPASVSLPAIAQGSLGLEARLDDALTLERIAIFHHEPTQVAVTAERAFLARLEGGCQVPIAGLATLEGGRVTMEGLVGSVDGKRIIRDRGEGPKEQAEAVGRELAERILDAGGRAILAEVYQTGGPR
ncbi:MAG TPA: hydroxymethylbilane synthase [bacterium]